MLKKLFFTLSLLFISSAHAQQACTNLFVLPEVTAAQTFFQLAMKDKLISQMDERLVQLGLIVPDGGLCASTCGVNVLRSLYEYLKFPHNTFKPDRRVRDIVRYAFEAWGVDARKGLSLEDLGNSLEVIAERLGDFHLQTKLMPGYVTERSLAPPANSLNIIAVTTTDPNITHALVVLEIHPADKIIVYSNPYESGKITYAPYEVLPLDGSSTTKNPLEDNWFEEHWSYINIITNLNAPHSEGRVLSLLRVSPFTPSE